MLPSTFPDCCLLVLSRDCNGRKNQQWYFDGAYIRSGLNNQKCLDVPGGNLTNGNKIQIW